MSNGYPVRGWLNGLLEGTVDIDEVEAKMNQFIELSCKKGYANGEIDTIKARSQVTTSYTKRDLTPLGTITFPKDNKALKHPFLDSVKSEFAWVAEKQEEKGIKKYGHELRPLDDYDWLEMAKEELVDAFKYLECERIKRARRG